jgi:hypothetical protein
MGKKIMVLALATACAALFAPPAAASAQTAHLSATTILSVTGLGGTTTSISPARGSLAPARVRVAAQSRAVIVSTA